MGIQRAVHLHGRRLRALGLGCAGIAAAAYGVKAVTRAEAPEHVQLSAYAGSTTSARASPSAWEGSQWRPSLPAAAGDVALAVGKAVTDLRSDNAKREAMYILRQTPVLRWLLLRSLPRPKQPTDHQAQHVLMDLLKDATTAQALLQCKGAAPMLFRAMAGVGWKGELADLVTKAVRHSAVRHASPEDMVLIIAMLKEGSGARTRRMAGAMITAWATASSRNCRLLAQSGAVSALGRAAVLSAGRGDGQRDVHGEVIRAMAAMAQQAPEETLPGVTGWINPLLYMAADAVASKDLDMAGTAIWVLDKCILRGGPGIREAVSHSNILHLLETLGREEAVAMQRAVASCLTTVVTAGGRVLNGDEIQRWTATLLEWMLADDKDEVLAKSASSALAGLLASPGQAGTWVAQHLLGHQLLHLADHAESRMAAAYSEAPPSAAKAPARKKVAVLPKTAREVGKQLHTAAKAAVASHEPSAAEEPALSITARAEYPKAAATVDAALAEEKTAVALKELSCLASGHRDRLEWLLRTGLLDALARLIGLDRQEAGESIPIGIKQSTARLLSIIATDRTLQHWIRKDQWVSWLKAGSDSPDCLLSSCCTKALLTLEATDGDTHCMKNLTSISAGLLYLSGESTRVGEELVLHDGVHLINPRASHHWILARDGTASTSPGAPLMDVLFIHGVNGNAFGTWRSMSPGRARDALHHEHIWPASWLAPEVEQARILSYEYSAPISTQGTSLSLEELVESTISKWSMAGIGDRPFVVICHSLGGLLLKEVVSRCNTSDASDREKQLATSLRGVVFFATPHFGSYLADIGWGLRRVGAKPSAVIQNLKPGPHHEARNEALKCLHDRGQVQVLSFGETLRTPLISIAPRLSQDAALKMEVVPMESAYPGYGSFVALQQDHINVCKPLSQADKAYTQTVDFVRGLLQTVQAAQGYSDADTCARYPYPQAD